MNWYRRILYCLFGLFVVVNGMYLQRVPGLLGDEGSEGENVYELFQREGITVVGERSYIGPAIDYLRIPFILLFGYTPIAIRLPMLLFSIATFFLAASVLKKQFGPTASLFGIVVLTFSPVYILYQRLGWTITLFPFFVFLIVWLAQRRWQSKWLWLGLAAGLGLANHIIFFPTLVGLGASFFVAGVSQLLLAGEERRKQLVVYGKAVSLAAIGFWAGFGMQFVVLQLKTEDQGDPSATTQLFSERVDAFIQAAPLYISGSSYVARYTGVEFSPGAQTAIVAILLLGVVVSIGMYWRKAAMWLWVIGLHAHLAALLYMIDRFTLRYFVVYSLGVWLLAGVGLGGIVSKVFKARRMLAGVVSCGVSLSLAVWVVWVTFLPFFATGGSTAQFGLGNRVDSAAAFVAIEPLVSCLHDRGPVFSESVHIWNRLQYLSHTDSQLLVVSEDHKKEAQILVQYRDEKNPQSGEICPELEHFRVRQLTKS